MKLIVPRPIYEAMIDHCRSGLPNEACGFLGGTLDGDATVRSVYRLTNAAASPVYYRPDDRQMIAAITEIERSGHELVAIFHSHVASPAIPSTTDVREAHYPDSVYLIVSLSNQDDPEVRGWLIRKKNWTDVSGEIEEADLVIS